MRRTPIPIVPLALLWLGCADGIYNEIASPSVVVDPLFPSSPGLTDYIQRETPELPIWREQGLTCPPASEDEPSNDHASDNESSGPHTSDEGSGGERDEEVMDLAERCVSAAAYREIRFPDGVELDSCEGVSVRDDGDVLRWRCAEDAGRVRLISTGFSSGRGLRDLVDTSTSTWRPLSVFVTRDGRAWIRSKPNVWWPNPIRELKNPNVVEARPVILDEPDTLYVAVEDITLRAPLQIEADGIALVGTFFRSNNDSNRCVTVENDERRDYNCAIFAEQTERLWLELTASGEPEEGRAAIVLVANRLGQIRNSRLVQFRSGLILSRSQGVRVHELRTSNMQCYGVLIPNSRGILIDRHHADNVGGFQDQLSCSALFIGSDASDVTVVRSHYRNIGDYGLLVYGDAMRATISHVSVASGRYSGISIRGNDTTLVRPLAVGFLRNGVRFSDASGTNVVGLLSTDHTESSLTLQRSDVAFRGEIVLSDSSEPCSSDDASTSTGVTVQESKCHGAAETSLRNGSIVESFVGPVSGDGDRDGAATEQECRMVSDWLGFDDPYHSWALAPVFDDNTRLPCRVDPENENAPCTCEVFDWSLRDTPGQAPGLVRPRSAPDASTACSDLADTLRVTLDAQSRTLVADALELPNDGFGNDNGLCERGERCVLSERFGAQQLASDHNRTCQLSVEGLGGLTLLRSNERVATDR
ncbi:MAG: right-handed parallel beta-helix repeat-containing protein [Myxococcota bacterium]